MGTKCGTALDDWLSLFTDEIENIWCGERNELRRVAMIFYSLKREFNRVEDDLNMELVKFGQKLELIDDYKRQNRSLNCNRQSSQVPINDGGKMKHAELERQLNKSPTIGTYGRLPRLKRLENSPSLLDIKNESAAKQVEKVVRRKRTEGLFDGYNRVDLSSIETTNNKNRNERSAKLQLKISPGLNHNENISVVDSSVIVEDTPDRSTTKKLKLCKKSKEYKLTKKEKAPFTLTQMFDYSPHETLSKKSTHKNHNRNLTVAQNDETYFSFEEENQDFSNVNRNNTRKPLKIDVAKSDFAKNYDKLPVARNTSPQHVHKTETVRRKADRMKLPGWSCDDCKQYYEGLNLPEGELRKKMDMCSKHRNKFPLLNETPQGFWDVLMPATQDDD